MNITISHTEATDFIRATYNKKYTTVPSIKTVFSENTFTTHIENLSLVLSTIVTSQINFSIINEWVNDDTIPLALLEISK